MLCNDVGRVCSRSFGTNLIDKPFRKLRQIVERAFADSNGPVATRIYDYDLGIWGHFRCVHLLSKNKLIHLDNGRTVPCKSAEGPLNYSYTTTTDVILDGKVLQKISTLWEKREKLKEEFSKKKDAWHDEFLKAHKTQSREELKKRDWLKENVALDSEESKQDMRFQLEAEKLLSPLRKQIEEMNLSWISEIPLEKESKTLV